MSRLRPLTKVRFVIDTIFPSRIHRVESATCQSPTVLYSVRIAFTCLSDVFVHVWQVTVDLNCCVMHAHGEFVNFR